MSSNKSFSSETANRYALALYELAKENSELEAVEKDIKELLVIYNTSENLKNFIKNPTQSQSSQLEVLNQMSVEMSLSKIIKNFLFILITKRRIFFFKYYFSKFFIFSFKKKRRVKSLFDFFKKFNKRRT